MNLLKLKGARVAKGYTQEELAKRLGMSAKTYNRKELGYIEFNRREIATLIDVLELNNDEVNDIFFNNELTDCISDDQASQTA